MLLLINNTLLQFTHVYVLLKKKKRNYFLFKSYSGVNRVS